MTACAEPARGAHPPSQDRPQGPRRRLRTRHWRGPRWCLPEWGEPAPGAAEVGVWAWSVALPRLDRAGLRSPAAETRVVTSFRTNVLVSSLAQKPLGCQERPGLRCLEQSGAFIPRMNSWGLPRHSSVKAGDPRNPAPAGLRWLLPPCRAVARPCRVFPRQNVQSLAHCRVSSLRHRLPHGSYAG